jgi:hypothetical protein
MEQMRGRVIPACGIAHVGVDFRRHDVAKLQAAGVDAHTVRPWQARPDPRQPLDRRRRAAGVR